MYVLRPPVQGWVCQVDAVMAERSQGKLVVQLARGVQAWPAELLRQRRTLEGGPDYLIRWTVSTAEEAGGSAGGSPAAGPVAATAWSSTGDAAGKAENILMWMSEEDVRACCGALLRKHKPEGSERGGTHLLQQSLSVDADSDLEEREFSSMRSDVIQLVSRARRQVERALGPEATRNISHIIHVLSAYASIGPLAPVFKEAGALDLLMELLCNKEIQTRRSAGRMLRALASHDAGSRAYVLLSLSQQDGIEQRMDFDNRFTLLELFAETTSSEEHGMSFEGIHLPQIPGRLLFSLVKRYLCVTSLADALSNTDGAGVGPGGGPNESSRLHREFDFCMAMANLITELARILGWDRQEPENQHHGTVAPIATPSRHSIFQASVDSNVSAPATTPPDSSGASIGTLSSFVPVPRVGGSGLAGDGSATATATANGSAAKQAKLALRQPGDFPRPADYGESVQAQLRVGMRVLMLEDYEMVSAGDKGEVRCVNKGYPPVQVYWDSMQATYWVNWNMVAIMPDESPTECGTAPTAQVAAAVAPRNATIPTPTPTPTPTQNLFPSPPLATPSSEPAKMPGRPLAGLYAFPYLWEASGGSERRDGPEEGSSLGRTHWWELHFFLRKLEGGQQDKACDIIRDATGLPVFSMDDASLAGLSVDPELALRLLRHLLQAEPPFRQDLRSSSLYRRFSSELDDLQRVATSRQITTIFGHGDACKIEPASSLQQPSSSSSLSSSSLSKKPKKEEEANNASSSSPGSPALVRIDAGGAGAVDAVSDPEGVQERLREFEAFRKAPSGEGGSTWAARVLRALAAWKLTSRAPSDRALKVAALQTAVAVLEERTQAPAAATEDRAGSDGEEQRSNKEGRQRPRTPPGTEGLKPLMQALVRELELTVEDVSPVYWALRVVRAVLVRPKCCPAFVEEGGVAALLACMSTHADTLPILHLAFTCLHLVLGVELPEPLTQDNIGGRGVVKAAANGSAGSRRGSESDWTAAREALFSLATSDPMDSPLAAIVEGLEKIMSSSGNNSAASEALQLVLGLSEVHQGVAKHLGHCGMSRLLVGCKKKALSIDQWGRFLEMLGLYMAVGGDVASELVTKLHRLQLPMQLRSSELCRNSLLVLDGWLSGETPRSPNDTQLAAVMAALGEPDAFRNILAQMNALRSDKELQLAVLRILSRLVERDSLPWHEFVETSLAPMNTHIGDKEVQQEFITLLHRLAVDNKDNAIVMCQLGLREAIGRSLERHGLSLRLAGELRDLVADCEKHAGLYRRLTTSILAGCIQMVLGQIEESRRTHAPIHIPFFNVFLRNLCQGSKVEMKEDKCWEKVEVSSNQARAARLTDGNAKTYWESNGSTGSHYINIFMHKGVVIRQLSVLVASEDSSYMPARLVVLGGEDPTDVSTELNAVNVPSSASRVLLLENATRYWPIVQIRIRRCQQGGIDTRVHGFEILGPKPTFWPVFREQLCRRTCLFYTVKAHTWTQALGHDRTHVLQLYSKMSAVLRHEQQFAERFLPDLEAARALGQTCWEALATPIISNISTVNKGDESSPFAWLLVEYLGAGGGRGAGVGEATGGGVPRRGQRGKSLVFASRARRLCRLLVHVDTSPAATEGTIRPPCKPDLKTSKGKERNGSSPPEGGQEEKAPRKPSAIAQLASCWAGVVQQQVSTFLDASWNAADFAELYQEQFARLSGAMRELFGNHAAFMLALREGFRSALLHLPHLPAVKVAEVLAQNVDRRIRALGVARASGDGLAQLMSSLEPITFLSGLEMANTFEHFYRFYLCERLLVLWALWLEPLVSAQLEPCFPGRLPQRMLHDLADSERAATHYTQYRLEKLDRSLASLSDEEMEDEMEEEEEEGEGGSPSAAAPELQVMVLSSAFWPVPPSTHMAPPARMLPPPLLDFVQEYTEFYFTEQRLFGVWHQQPKRLQWTWLGRAVLASPDGRFSLLLSTLQMFVLLLFNRQQEVLVEEVARVTDAAPSLLRPALAALLGPSGVLASSDADLDSLTGVLRINETALEAMSSSGDGPVSLLPAQTYPASEELVTRLLERKKNVLSCAIMHILKAEFELHIDHLVHKVVEVCQKGSLGGRTFARFTCSAVEVSWCIERLLHKGYLCREDDSPQVLYYVPSDPASPDKRRAYSSWRHLDTISNHGRAGTAAPCPAPGDATVPKQVVPQVEVALSSRWLSAGRTLSQEDVRRLMTGGIAQVQEVLGLSVTVAEHLLVHCGWNMDVLLQRFAEAPVELMRAAGLAVRNAPPPAPPPQPLAPAPSDTCPVCLLTTVDHIAPLCCRHSCCKSCWREYLSMRVEQNMVTNCKCPISECLAQPPPDFIRSILEQDAEALAMYNRGLVRCYVESCTNLTWCTNPQGCDRILCTDSIGHAGTCAKCHWSSCFSCNFLEAHYPASCGHMSQWMDDGGYYEGMNSEALSKHLAKLISKRCPSCQAQIEKNEGCLHMTCAKCNHGFCWRCLKPWKPTHKDYYNCSGMVSRAAKQEKKFHDYNEMCIFHQQAREFAVKLAARVAAAKEHLPLHSLVLVTDACNILVQARKVLSYCCVYSYYSQEAEKMTSLGQQMHNLELNTNSLQVLLEKSLLHCTELAWCVRLLKPVHLALGRTIIGRIQERLLAILHASTQDFRVGLQAEGSATMDRDGESAPNAENRNINITIEGTEAETEEGGGDDGTGEEGENDETWREQFEFEYEDTEDDFTDEDDEDEDDTDYVDGDVMFSGEEDDFFS
ncbi:cullin-9-like isoform X3 [Petromyzon marinus]|uniref:cullin-9-like isoform X3 n=1 Tax=Petromyzon marinus TaxID=7757 RepID=UPI003F6FB54F